MSFAYRPLIAVLLLSLASGVNAKKKTAAPAAPAAPSACADFYGSVNQSWLQAHPLPSGAQSFSRWDELNANAERQSQELLAKTTPITPSPAASLLSDLVASAMDPTGLDAAAQATAQPLLAQINGIRKPKDIAKVVAALHGAGVPVLFGFDALRDPDTGQARASFYPAGLGLPDPSYYSSTAPELQQASVLYRAYVGELLKFSGVAEDKIAEQTSAVLAIEQSLAAAMGSSRAESMSIVQLGKSYPALFLPDFMQVQGSAPALISIQQPAFFGAINRMLAKPSIPQWQAYLRAQLGHSLAPTLSRDLRQPYLAVLKLAPATAATPAERLTALSRDEAAELFSAAYAESYLGKAEQQRAEAIGEAIRAAMGRAIDRATWLSDAGKAASQTKLAAMRLAIGEPIETVSFAELKFDRRNLAGNVLALRRWNRARSLARLSSAVWPWPISQSQPAIGYQPAENRLIVTAAALRAPAFEGKSVASDYGSFGALLAQQMSLAFADYTEGDGRALAGRQAGLIAQFDAYQATPTVKVNSLRTQRQNAADLAAIELAWDAFNAQGTTDVAAKKEFFTAWASVWARQDNSSALAAAQAQSAFAPARWRVNGPLVNTPTFTQAFACKPGQKMFKAGKDQLAIWR
jgi:putative endopeptidase